MKAEWSDFVWLLTLDRMTARMDSLDDPNYTRNLLWAFKRTYRP